MTQSLKGIDGITPLPGASGPALSSFPLYDVTATLLRRRRTVYWWTAVAVLLTGVVTFLPSRTYTAQASFVAEQRSQSSALSGLAAQFGIAVPVADAGRSPSFYADLVKSPAILRRVLQSQYVGDDTRAQSLTAMLDVTGDTPAQREEQAIRALQDMLSAALSQKTGVIALRLTARTPSLAAQVLDTLLDAVNRFNLNQRQSQAATERRFTERRLVEVQADLRQAEDRATGFLERNRDYRNSPMLINQYERLAREVATRQALVTTLSQAFEQAKIEEVRDTPVITVIEAPQVPAHPDSRNGLLKLLVALALGITAGAGIALTTEALRNDARDARREGELAALGREALADLRRPWRLMRKAPRGM
ncbi:MAG: Wzz/FepE/Etk N-terminal domain-containing protein [Gemmatimonadaceae bacterium]